MKSFFTLILISALGFIYPAKAQHKSADKLNTIVIFTYKSDTDHKDSMCFEILKPFNAYTFSEHITYPRKIISFIKTPDSCQTICQYDINEAGCAFMFDGFGQEIFINPGDTIRVKIGEKHISKPQNGISIPWFHEISYSGKNHFFYEMFGKLAEATGALHFGAVLHPAKTDSTLEDYKIRVQQLYQKRLDFVNSYNSEHPIPPFYLQLVKADIYNAYIDDLLRPLWSSKFTLSNYPPAIANELKQAKFTDVNIYNKTVMSHRAAYDQARLIFTSTQPSTANTNKNLVAVYQTIKTHYTGTIREHLLAVHLKNYLTKRDSLYTAFDSLFADYKQICHNEEYVHSIGKAWEARKSKGQLAYTLEDAMASRLQDTSGKSLRLQSLFHQKPVLIICWASWCVPCIKEFPAEQAFEKQYGDKIDFIYLSFDRNKTQWLNKAADLKINSKSYLLVNYFQSDLANYYRISSIPTYLVYDQTGKQVDIKAIRPSDHDQFKNLLDKLSR